MGNENWCFRWGGIPSKESTDTGEKGNVKEEGVDGSLTSEGGKRRGTDVP